MRIVDLIAKKRDGAAHTQSELSRLMDGYCRGEVPDYQMAAWAMAVYFQGMTASETAELTLAMAQSGEQIDLSPIPGVKVDKHSTGGVGDKTTLIVAPLVAACGVPVAKMSGRGLGHTGGTIDKLESIPGMRTELGREAFLAQVASEGLAVVGQSGNLTPADKRLYGLRDVTATVESIPLIASSIMSKKIAAGADAIVLDVKCGNGAFMKTAAEAEALAEAMVAIGSGVGRATTAVISSMAQPLGTAIGNALEVAEAIRTLQGEGSEDLTELSLLLAAHMVRLGGAASSEEEAMELVRSRLADGSALRRFARFVAAQGGDASVADAPDERLPQAPYRFEVSAEQEGVVAEIDAAQLGTAAMILGAGRAEKDEPIDHAVGLTLLRKLGEPVRAGEALAALHARTPAADEASRLVREAFRIVPAGTQTARSPLVLSIVTESGVQRMQ
ncbi:pyrimidine-nucleoside phosphorylase [Paenibacillus sp. IB182496]|uniref:Pyrimidine-nucleoside phosphorylase n=1 Tax=Paenibacillus sabuli TaxID=2772509 RepID=A0A927GT03_9BACL|nr:pyrimidine-nucleoside phosphorylase [Paenibacillus sabuli]MBD2846826.1 pyrimidine-nucleoside phosphorylase [Paenibacillus sabuli]